MTVRHDFTVPELIRDLGFEVENELSWAAGVAVRRKWKEQTGQLPEKRLRGKSSGAGSHCFAVYPGHFYDEARKIVELYAERLYSARAAQLRLFDEGDS